MKKQANCHITLLILMGLATLVSAQNDASLFDENILLIRFNANASTTAINNLKNVYGAIELDVSPVSAVRKWRLPAFPTPPPFVFNEINEVVQHANSQPEVTGAGLNYKTEAFALQNPGTATPWTAQGLCSYALGCSSGTAVMKVAILDTGIGYNCSLVASYFEPGNRGYDFVNHDNDPMDDQGHGSHIAGTIVKVARLSENPAFHLLAYKTHGANGKGEVFDVILAVDRAMQEGVHILNMSFSYNSDNGSQSLIAGAYEPTLISGTSSNTQPQQLVSKKAPLEIAINKAEEQGILVVAAAGNKSQDNDVVSHPSYPASFTCPNILSVASVNCAKGLSEFSNWGHQSVDIAAPGELIESIGLNCSTAVKSGSSQATAVLSGVALELGTNFNGQPFNYNRVKCAILNGASYASGLTQKVLTQGIVNGPDAYSRFVLNNCAPVGTDRSRVLTETDQRLFETSPNPFTNALRIRFDPGTSGLARLTIFDAQGKAVFANAYPAEKGQQEVYWEPAAAVSGLYSIRLQTSEGVHTSKAILLR